ncbi:MAG: TRAP transporter small permease [Hyphomicrobiales bacterium]
MKAVLKNLIAFNSRVATFALVASGLLVALIAIVVAAGVFWRYVLNDSLSWTEEVSRYLLIWLAAIGSIVAMHRRELVAIDLLPDALSSGGRRALRVLISLIVIGTSTVVAFYGWSLAVNAWGQSASTFPMPLFFVTAAIPVAAGAYVLMALEQALTETTKCDRAKGAVE